MMFRELFDSNRDERSSLQTGRCAVVFLGITQILLLLLMLRRRYMLGQPSAEIWDIQAVLLISIFGYIGARLYLGGALPALSLKGAAVAYFVLAGLVTAGSLAIHGVPHPSNWASTWLPALLGPAILVGLYSLIAYMGKRRIDGMMGSDDSDH